MTEQEALEILKRDDDDMRKGYFCLNDFMALEVAKTALEKRIAKKPNDVDEQMEEEFYYLSFLCPSCGGSVTGQPYRPDYCKHCGQRLNWDR